MIESVLIFNTAGKARLSKHYTALAPASRAKLLTRIFDLISTRVRSLPSPRLVQRSSRRRDNQIQFAISSISPLDSLSPIPMGKRPTAKLTPRERRGKGSE